jgi:hypothetical protein
LKLIATGAVTSERTVRRWYQGERLLPGTVLRLEQSARGVGAPIPGSPLLVGAARFVSENPGATTGDVARALSTSSRSAQCILREAKKRREVERVGEGNQARWYAVLG